MLAAGVASAHPPTTGAKPAARFEMVSMRGEIVDPQCYFTHDSRGVVHASCAAMCAKGGQGLAFLEESSGTVYPLIAKAHGTSQNDGLLPHLGKPVQVKGQLVRKGGNAVLRIDSIIAAATANK
jgi:hypothetical protein